MAMALADFTYIKNLVEEEAGNLLESQRDYIVESRLQVVAERSNIKSVPALIAKLRTNDDAGLVRDVLEAMVNHETMFFRDVLPFDILRTQVLPDLLPPHGNERSLNIWSAACSSGQEAYSIAMMVSAHFPDLAPGALRIVASDYSQSILRRAASASFSQIEVNRGLPAHYLVKYFERHGLCWQLRPEIRKLVSFRYINLTQPLPPLPRMDVIFLRNALIYFDLDKKRRILAQIEKQLRPGGYLFLGAAETTINLSQAFERCFDRASCYRLRATPAEPTRPTGASS